MDTLSLRYFQQVAVQRNFSRAARHFFVSQSTLSRQIANLENELGAKLFDRDTRNVALTKAGAVLYQHCPLLLNHFDTVLRRVDAVNRGQVEPLTIATVSEFRSRLSGIVRRFRERHPEAALIVDDLSFETLTDAVLEGVYDFGLTLDFMVPAADQIEAILVGREPMMAVARGGSQPPLGPSVPLSGLLGRVIAVPAAGHPELVSRLKLAARQPGAPETVFLRCPNSQSALLRVAFSDAVTLMPRTAVEERIATGEFDGAEISDPSAWAKWYLLTSKDREAPLARQFVAAARACRSGAE
ncbi:MAG: LysR family transcriptional regulator [Bifidobacteriaceae bacterium]|nr:LysR family transcriptional regulator [Bifidobacteriaceae bacterium]